MLTFLEKDIKYKVDSFLQIHKKILKNNLIHRSNNSYKSKNRLNLLQFNIQRQFHNHKYLFNRDLFVNKLKTSNSLMP